MKWQDYIEQDPAVMGGKPVIKGTRIAVALILERLGNGWPIGDVLASLPGLTEEHIRAALAYAAAYLDMEDTVFLHSSSS